MTATLTEPTVPEAGPPPRSGWLTDLLRRLHFIAGIVIGPFILVAAISGGLYAATPQLEAALYAHELRTDSTGPVLSLAEQVTAAQEFIGPDRAPSAVRPAPEPGATTRVMYAEEGLAESESRAIFVDPVTAEIRGDLTVYGTSGALPLRTWIDHLHRNLHLGEPGRIYSELAASWLGVIALAGLGLWVLGARRSRRARAMLLPQRGLRGARRTRSWHQAIGIWAVLGMLFLSATGITWSTHGGQRVADLRAALDWSTPSVSTALDGTGGGDAGEHTHHGGGAVAEPIAGSGPAPGAYDAVLSAARDVNVNTGLVEIRPPAEDGTAWVVQEIKRSHPTEVDSVAVDGRTLEVVDRADFAEFPLGAKLSRWGIDLHMGTHVGLVNQLALVLLSAAITAMVVWGYAMWWQRRPRRSWRPGAAPRSGALHRAPWWGIGLVLGAAIALGWFLPLLGWSLVGFVLIDLLLSWRASRRSRS